MGAQRGGVHQSDGPRAARVSYQGVATNLAFLQNLINHPHFRAGNCTTRFVDETPELFRFPVRQDRASRLLGFLGEVIVNGNPEVEGRAAAASRAVPKLPQGSPEGSPDQSPVGHRQRLLDLGPKRFAEWMLESGPVLVTDTTMRDAHQSLFATRMRSRDLWEIAPYYSKLLAGAVFHRMLGRCDLRRRHAVPQRRTPGSVCTCFASASRTSCCRCCCAPPTPSATPIMPTMWCVILSGRRPLPVSISFACSMLSIGSNNMRVAMDAVLEEGQLCEAGHLLQR